MKQACQEIRGPVVQRVDNSIHWINLYLVDNANGFPNTYPLESDLSGGYNVIPQINLHPVDHAIGFPNTSPLDNDLSGR